MKLIYDPWIDFENARKLSEIASAAGIELTLVETRASVSESKAKPVKVSEQRFSEEISRAFPQGATGLYGDDLRRRYTNMGHWLEGWISGSKCSTELS